MWDWARPPLHVPLRGHMPHASIDTFLRYVPLEEGMSGILVAFYAVQVDAIIRHKGGEHMDYTVAFVCAVWIYHPLKVQDIEEVW